MTRAFYFLGGLIAMALIVLASLPLAAPSLLGGSAQPRASAAATLPAEPSSALDDLAAWPIAAGR
jgi:hypothetical protein